jgi:threonine dehydrogenase-like Zn-dependent dehydrogenase
VWVGRPWFQYPFAAGAPGHEAWGVIDALGSAVHEFQIGDRIALLSSRAYAQYDIAKADQVLTLPPALDRTPFPGEALGCVMNIFKRSKVSAGETIAIIGIGFLGALLTRLASQAGARVLAISRRHYALRVAKTLGAAEVIPFGEQAIENVMALTDSAGCDCVIEAVGKQQPLDLAGEITRERGRLVIAGYHQGQRQVNMQLWNWRGLDVINAHERQPPVYLRGISDAIAAVTSGTIDPLPLYTHKFSLEELPEAYATLAARPEGFMKALIII